MKIRSIAFLIVWLLSPSILLAQSEGFERFVVPVLIDTPAPGAHGSIWTTEFLVRNTSTSPVRAGLPTGDCQLLNGSVIPAGATHTLADTLPGPPPTGPFVDSVVFLSEAQSDDRSPLLFNLRVRDASREALTWGTDIPVVSERSFSSEAFEIIGLPTEERFRTALRIYSFAVTGKIELRIFELNGSTPLATAHLDLTRSAEAGEPRCRPSRAEITDIASSFPILRSVSQVRVEIVPVGDTSIWAFASTTNNETQHVTTILGKRPPA